MLVMLVLFIIIGNNVVLLYRAKSLKIVPSNAEFSRILHYILKEWVDIYEKTK